MSEQNKDFVEMIKHLQEIRQSLDNPKFEELFGNSKIEELLNTRLTREHGFDDRYALPDGMVFTFKMYIDLLMYFDFIEDLNDKYGTTSLLDLRKKLGIM